MFYVVLYKKKLRQVWYNFHFFHIACIFWFTCNYLLHDLFTQGKSYCPLASVNMIFLWWIDIFTSSETSYMCLPTKFTKNITTATVQKNNSDMNYWEKIYWHQCLDVSDISGENFYSQKNYQQITNLQTCVSQTYYPMFPLLQTDKQANRRTDRHVFPRLTVKVLPLLHQELRSLFPLSLQELLQGSGEIPENTNRSSIRS